MPKQERKVNLAATRLMPPWIVCQLNMSDLGQMPFNRSGEITFHDLSMINIILQGEVIAANQINDADGRSGGRNQKARRVMGVQRLDQKLDSRSFAYRCCEAQILDQNFPRPLHRHVVGGDAGQAIEARTTQSCRILDSQPDAILKLGHAMRIRSDPALTCRPLSVSSRREVEKRDFNARCQRHLGKNDLILGIRKVKLDGVKPGSVGGGKTLDELPLGKKKGQVGRELQRSDGAIDDAWHATIMPKSERDGGRLMRELLNGPLIKQQQLLGDLQPMYPPGVYQTPQ